MTIPAPRKPTRRGEKKTTRVQESASVQKRIVSSPKKSLPKVDHSRGFQTDKPQGGSSWPLFFILLALLVVGWIYRGDISSFVKNPDIDTGKTISGADSLFVGKELLVQGVVERNTNKKHSYTHTLNDSTHGVLGLRSSSINLYGLTGDISLAGKVVDFTNNMYVLEITTIVSDAKLAAEEILYFDKPGLLLQNISKDGFVITENKSTQSINISNSSTKANINIRYFVCGKEKTNNCNEFVESFKNTSGSQSVDSYNNVFYKLNDENTWFTNLNDRYGVSIETSNPQLFSFIIEKIQFITTQWTQEHLNLQAMQYCQEGTKILQKINSSVLTQNKSGFNWNISGTDVNLENISCTLSFYPNDLEKGITAAVYAEKVEEQPISPTLPEDTNPTDSLTGSTTDLPASSSKQFPLRPGKELLFSTQGMTIQFPSPNIAFSSINISEELQGVKCYAKTYVIEYAKKDELTTSPSLVMYFCSGDVTSLESTMRKISYKGTTIVVQILDPSWTDFANAIILQ